MIDLSIIEVTFTTMSPRLISSAARLKACSFSLVIPKIPSSSILIFLAIFAHLNVVVHLAYHQLLPIWMSVTLLTVEGEWNSKMPLAIFVLLTIGTLTLLILFLLKFFMMQTDGALKQDCGDLTITLEKGAIFDTKLRIIFLAPIWQDEIVIIIWSFSYFETRTRLHIVALMSQDLWKSFLVVKREKMKLTPVANSRDREFLLTSGLITLMNSLNWFGGLAREFGFGVLSPSLAKPQICILI